MITGMAPVFIYLNNKVINRHLSLFVTILALNPNYYVSCLCCFSQVFFWFVTIYLEECSKWL